MLFLYMILGLLAITLGFSLIVYYLSYYNGNRKDVTYETLHGPEYDAYSEASLALTKEAVRIPFEPAETLSCDGLKLFGRVYLRDKTAPFHIEFNGYKGVGIRDFAGGMQLALARNDNVLLVDQRSHGASEGTNITFGIKERKDVLTWVQYVIDRFGSDTEIFLEGISMGAATVLMASGEDLPENVRGILADCPYSTPFKILSRTAAGMIRVPHLADPFLVIAAWIYAHFNPLETSAVQAVRRAKVPILIVHGKADTLVPYAMSEEIRDAAPEKVTLEGFDGAPHGLSFLTDREKYTAIVNRFWDHWS
ncbi:MAG: prolyl oligopeptidase family serine peptidase [Lachnospiraceae bacterium]|nr:prolyl oligopeptidase family serine peptidase [Lachnospiraceae bacterium]